MKVYFAASVVHNVSSRLCLWILWFGTLSSSCTQIEVDGFNVSSVVHWNIRREEVSSVTPNYVGWVAASSVIVCHRLPQLPDLCVPLQINVRSLLGHCHFISSHNIESQVSAFLADADYRGTI